MVLKRKKVAFVLILFFVPGICFILLNLPQKPPSEKIKTALKSLADARKSKAHIYFPKLFQDSEKLYKSAMYHLRVQNEKSIFKRQFFLSEFSATFSIYFANKAKKQAVIISKDLKASVKSGIRGLKDELNTFDPFIRKLPVPEKIRKEFSHAVLFLSESDIAYKKSEYLNSHNKLDKAYNCYTKAFEYTDSILSEYFTNIEEWQRLSEKAINKSRKNKSYVLIIDKFSHQGMLYFKGNIKRTYTVELGRNWIGNKLYSGDKATPEGEYKIIGKKNGNSTKYHKALLINYPNENDHQRFKLNIRNGIIKKSDQIGGSIEIHGGGGKGVDWTDGCVALTNKDVDNLFNLVPSGTPVLIVGSLKNLDSYYNF